MQLIQKQVCAESGLRKHGVCQQVAFEEPRNDQRIIVYRAEMLLM